MNRMEKMLAQANIGAGEGVLIHKPSNMFYLSGYTGEGLIAAGSGFQHGACVKLQRAGGIAPGRLFIDAALHHAVDFLFGDAVYFIYMR